MRSQTDTLAGRGVGGRFNWLIGGGVGGLVGALLFGALLWVVNPAIVRDAIPQLYGLENGGPTGWAFHLAHGIVFGVVFGFIITRSPVMGTLMADVETPVIDSMGANLRIVAAGLVYGLAVWVVFPGIVLTVVVAAGDSPDTRPWGSVLNLAGHLVYGMLLGALVSLFTDIELDVREAEAPFEEAGGP